MNLHNIGSNNNFGNTVVQNNGVIFQTIGNGFRTVTINGTPQINEKLKNATKLELVADGEIISSFSTQNPLHVEIHANSIEKVNSVSGDITLHGAMNGNIQSTSGDIHIHGKLSHDCNTVTTVSGDVSVEGNLNCNNISTISGNIRAPSKHASSLSGRIQK